MGKSKSKKPRQASEQPQSPNASHANVDIYEPIKAIDGHSTQGWTDSEIKAYNELIVERQRLEKQRQELEEKCAKSQTQRALLHENVADIDSMFKQNKSTSTLFFFTGSNRCCVELDQNLKCHHEICKRAKTNGITDAELDTIKYYSMRVSTEKSERMRNALRKQRDLELIRIKKEDEEGQAQNAKKLSKQAKSTYSDIAELRNHGRRGKDMSRAAKETEKIVNKIIHQLDDLRSDLQNGRITAEEAQGKLNILDSKLPVMQEKASQGPNVNGIVPATNPGDIKMTTDSFQNHLRDRLLNAKGDTFSQAFSIMDHFLSATKSDDLQEAISELKDVLQLSGPMCDELRNSLSALEGIFDNPDKLAFTGPDGKQECTSIIDLMEKLKESLKRTGQLPDGANASLTKVFQECIDLEAEAKEQLTQKCSDELTTSADLPSALAKVKEGFVAKSPIPPLTSNKLDVDIANLLDVYDARQLIAKASSGAKMTELEAQITSLVISRTQRKPAKYIEKLERMDLACRSAGDQQGVVPLRDAIANVLVKMEKWVPTAEVKRVKQASQNSDNVPRTPTNNTTTTRQDEHKAANEQDHKSKTVGNSESSISTQTSENLTKQAQRALHESIEKHGKYGLWDTFEVYCRKTLFEADAAMLEKAESYKTRVRMMVEDKAHGMKATVAHLYKLKLCPGLTAVLISQAILDIADTSDDGGREYMKQFSTCLSEVSPSISPEWAATFQHIVLAMTQLYVATYVESLAAFPRISSLYFAVNTMAMVTTFVHLTRSSQIAHCNIKVMTGFLLICFGEDALRLVPSLHNAIVHFGYFCGNDGFRCSNTGPCSKHMNFARMPFKTAPANLNDSSKGGPMEEVAPSNNPIPNTTGVDVPTSPDDQIMVEQEAQRPTPLQRIKPMKTIITYPPNCSPRHHRRSSIKKRDKQLASTLKRAVLSHESAARRALGSAQFRPGDETSNMLPPPSQLVAAIDDILNGGRNDANYARSEFARIDLDATSTVSRFAEHLEDATPTTEQAAIESALIIQNTFKRLRPDDVGEQYLGIVVEGMKQKALSGKYPNPIDAVNNYVVALVRSGSLPPTFEAKLEQLQNDLRQALEDPKIYLECETRRLKHLLSMVAAHEPSKFALFRLASELLPAFHEYHEIISDRLEETETTTAEFLEQAWADVTQLVTTTKLRHNSPSLVDFARYARADWSQRPRDITGYGSDHIDDDAYFSPEEDDFDQIDEFRVVATRDGSPIMSKSPAKQPMLKQQSPSVAAIEFQASFSTTEIAAQPNTSADRSVSLSDTTEEQLAGSNVKAALASASVIEQTTRLIHNGKTDHLVTQRRDTLLKQRDCQYLLPADQMNSYNVEQAGTEVERQTTPASFRMLDMMKHLAALQQNSSDLRETARTISAFNKQHGAIVEGIASKMAARVVDYTSFAEQIAEWNGVSLEKHSISVDQYTKVDSGPAKKKNRQ